jgi:hypothetical protein
LSEVFVQSTLDAVATAGCVTVLLFGFWYAHARQKKGSDSGGKGGVAAFGSCRVLVEVNTNAKASQQGKDAANTSGMFSFSDTLCKKMTSLVGNGTRA